MRIAFYCKTPSVVGGRTPIASVRAITARLPKDLLEEFAARGVRYIRNLNARYGMPLAYAFGTTDRATIEAHCADKAMAIEWLGESEARLTLQRPALARHPQTGEELWFNNVGFWSRQNWDRASQALLRKVPSTEVAFHTTFGDGGEIPDSTVRAVRDAYEAASAGFDWQEGDLLVLDNMLCAHGREGFDGPRAIWTLMARTHARP
jgi:alpha-ketoglutarate-dependent taurine dioxygenase